MTDSQLHNLKFISYAINDLSNDIEEIENITSTMNKNLSNLMEQFNELVKEIELNNLKGE